MDTMKTIDGVVIGSEIYAPAMNALDYATSPTMNEIAGIETYAMDTALKMDANMPTADEQFKPIIITNGTEHNIYLNSSTAIGDPRYVNEICLFLDTVQNGNLNIFLGSGVDDSFMISVSSIVHAIQNIIATNRATVTTYAYGFCSIPETMIWAYGQNRVVGEYGAIRFGGGEWIRRSKEAFQSYMTTYLEYCVEQKLIDASQIDDILIKQREFMYISDNGVLKAI